MQNKKAEAAIWIIVALILLFLLWELLKPGATQSAIPGGVPSIGLPQVGTPITVPPEDNAPLPWIGVPPVTLPGSNNTTDQFNVGGGGCHCGGNCSVIPYSMPDTIGKIVSLGNATLKQMQQAGVATLQTLANDYSTSNYQIQVIPSSNTVAE